TTGEAVSIEESPSRPPELWWITEESARSLDLLNPAPLPTIGAVHHLDWVSSSGERLFATLRLPPDVRSGEKLPVVLSVYPGRRGLENSQHFLSGRYEPLRSRARVALLTPDMPVKFGSGKVCADLARYAEEALDAAVALGHVDGTRAGVIGISYGGYAVNCIISHSTRFRAAVSEAGPSDLASTHTLGGRGEWNVTKSWQWETPDRIVAESPVYHLDKVKTPVLFVTGKTDLNNALQEYEMYFGLLALKQPAALVSYDKAGHGDYDRFPDFWPRIARWFEVYLNNR
ncbi:MAG TPA: prolyl oligopeptidase family serine peptidase, partial [Pyrinomonadaceae bacterium]|nr:prolyl oligopeptidase family serine peptidase [Pyrinomonadaceae bacterium]